ncbi:hypothetical protein WAI453_006199 [Rhynchosporium graminicola]
MDVFSSMDSETVLLILQLQIEDSNELFSSCEGKGKGIEGVLSDTQVAVRLYHEELQRSATIIKDRNMTRSLARACLTDGNMLVFSYSQEQQESRDRRVALRLGGVPAPRVITDGPARDEDELDDDVLERLNALYICAAGNDLDSDSHSEDNAMALVPYHSTSSSNAETSTWAASRKSRAPKHHCTACRDTFSFCELSRAPCTHEYCRSCLQDLFITSMTDDTLFPPRCCRQPITPSMSIRIYLTTKIVDDYEAKKVEFDTPNRTYCSNPLCSSFIRTNCVVEERASCQVCQVVTCTICKGTAHDGDCPEDEALNLVLETARQNEWQRCYNCNRLVELATGCNHITCTCRAEFCYKCGERWKTCQCAQWDEHRLYARTEVVVARRAAVHQPPEQQEARFAAVMQDLVERHECDHNSWRWVRGPHECEECRHDLPDYIFECQQCHIQACNRCRRNRL